MIDADYKIAKHLPESIDKAPVPDLAQAVDMALSGINSDLLLIYPAIDNLPEALIDHLAVQMHVDEYDDSDLMVKRKQVKESFLLHRYKGTKYAVQQAITTVHKSALIQEWTEYGGDPYHFRVKLSTGTLGDATIIDKMTRAINAYKNVRSWLDYFVIFASNPFKLNSCKRDDSYIPETHKTTWITEIVFKTGLNKSCGTIEKIESNVARIKHHETIFSGKKINGKFRRIVLNDSQSYKKQWDTTQTVQKKKKTFNIGGYSLNNVGITQIKKIDIGYDKEVIEKQFTQGTTNNGAVKISPKDQTLRIAHRWKTFRADTMNGEKDIRLNGGQVQKHEKSEVKITHMTMKTFIGALTNGRQLTNNSPTTTIRRTVHTPIYKNIIQKPGATLLNMTDHTTKKRAVETIIPGKIIKRFSPTKGVILNSHALMGYIKIQKG